MKPLAATLLALLLAGGFAAVSAQDTLTYDQQQIEPEPEKGPVQCIFWDRDEVRHEDPNGVTLDVTGTGVIVLNDVEHGWLIAGKVALDPEDIAGLQVGDDCGAALGR